MKHNKANTDAISGQYPAHIFVHHKVPKEISPARDLLVFVMQRSVYHSLKVAERQPHCQLSVNLHALARVIQTRQVIVISMS